MTPYQFACLIGFILIIGIAVICLTSATVIAYKEYKEAHSYQSIVQQRLNRELRGLERRATRVADAIRMDAQQVSEEMERQARKLRE